MYCKFSPALGFTIAVISEEERQEFSDYTVERLQNILYYYLRSLESFEYEYRALCITKDGKYIYVWVNEPDVAAAEKKLELLFGYAQKNHSRWRNLLFFRAKRGE